MKHRYIVVHTSASAVKSNHRVDADEIRKWHLARVSEGFTDIGYHYVVLHPDNPKFESSPVEKGRPENRPGAHCQGLNSQSIGICVVGNGDQEDFHPFQKIALTELCSNIIDRYRDITTDHIVGHREVNVLIARGVVHSQYRTAKSCPGTRVDMDQIRKLVLEFRTFAMVNNEGQEFPEPSVKDGVDDTWDWRLY